MKTNDYMKQVSECSLKEMATMLVESEKTNSEFKKLLDDANKLQYKTFQDYLAKDNESLKLKEEIKELKDGIKDATKRVDAMVLEAKKIMSKKI